MNRCQTCLHWKRIKDTCFGKCSCSKFVEDMNNWPTDGVVYFDAKHVRWGESFGCVHWTRSDGSEHTPTPEVQVEP